MTFPWTGKTGGAELLSKNVSMLGMEFMSLKDPVFRILFNLSHQNL